MLKKATSNFILVWSVSTTSSASESRWVLVIPNKLKVKKSAGFYVMVCTLSYRLFILTFRLYIYAFSAGAPVQVQQFSHLHSKMSPSGWRIHHVKMESFHGKNHDHIYKVSPFLQIKFRHYSPITVHSSTSTKVQEEFLDCKIVIIVKQAENVIKE